MSEEKPAESNESPEESAAETPESTEADALARAEAEIADLKDRYMRAAAEVENMRRRFEREKADLLKYGQEKLFLDVLPALDSLDRALPEEQDGGQSASEAPAGDSYREGMRMVKRQILDVFRRHGLEPIAVKGVAFDPNLHQAIQKIDSEDVAVETVKDEFAKGYLLNGRLLRPAMVSVLTPSQGS